MADVELLPMPSEVRLAIRAYARACVEANLAPLQAENERLAEVLRLHIEDLERSAVVLDQYPAMAPTAAEMRKAAAELRAALHPTAAQAAEIEQLREEVRYRDASLGWWGRFASDAVNARKEAEVRAERLAEALRDARRALAFAAQHLPECNEPYERANRALAQ